MCHGTPRKYIKRYAKLNYDTSDHSRVKRDLDNSEYASKRISFESHGRYVLVINNFAIEGRTKS